MIIHQGYENLDLKSPAVTLGIFDGVHTGHRALIARLNSRARITGGESVIITFYPHPRLVLAEDREPLAFLSTPREKYSLLEKEGVGNLVIIPFDHELSNKEACDFIEEVLVKKIKAKYLIAGFNHHFGKRGEAGFAAIRQCAESFNIVVEQLDALVTEMGIVSSSLIRKALIGGDLDAANLLLGYNYSVTGTIVEGKRLGRIIGFPTANIKPVYELKLIPKDGVYAVDVILDGATYNGMLSIGSNPTVNDDPGKRTIEVNIFDFEEDVYGYEITVVFRKRLRDEIRFKNVALLTEQLGTDKKMAMRFLRG
jgi:riboflavin kinase/FMN adenylyltransferase